MSSPKFITSYVQDGEGWIVEGGEASTEVLLKNLAKQGIVAETIQVGEPRSKCGTYDRGDGTRGWHLQIITRQHKRGEP